MLIIKFLPYRPTRVDKRELIKLVTCFFHDGNQKQNKTFQIKSFIFIFRPYKS